MYTAHGAISQLRLGNGLIERTAYNSRLQPTQIALGTTADQMSVLWRDRKLRLRRGRPPGEKERRYWECRVCV